MKLKNSLNSVFLGVFVFAFVLIANDVFAQGLGKDGDGHLKDVNLWVALVGGAAQLIVGVFLAVTSIAIGINILGKVLPKVNVTDELKKANRSVGIMTAGVVVAYTKVISTGITQIGDAISTNPSLGAVIGGLVNVLVGVLLASIGVTWAFRALNRVTPSIRLEEELNKDNLAVGLFVAGVLYGISEMIAAGVSGVGQAVGSALSAIF